jgi:outer membrane protein OmpA-like peptidoglycan-associated protein
MNVSTRIALAATIVLAALAPAMEAQSLKDRLRAKAKAKVEQAAERAADQATDKAVTAVEGVIRCLVTDEPCLRRAQAAGAPVAVVDAQGSPVSAADSAAALARASGASTARPGAGAWARYDFVPGTRPLFVEDFARDEVGDFPRRLELVSGSGEIVEWQGQRLFRARSDVRFHVPLPETLPERFSLEIEYAGSCCRNLTVRFFGDDAPAGAQEVWATSENAGLVGGGMSATGAPEKPYKDEIFAFRVMADGRHAKLYMNEHRIAAAPNAQLGRSNRILVSVPGSTEHPGVIRSIRVAAGGRELYDAIAEHGRIATQGILFDAGRDVLRPESTPTLRAIARMMREHDTLRLVIEGHTDAVGDDAANLALSERRAAAVVAYLTTAEGIAAARLSAKGLGESRPAATNDTPEGRQTNRRVELVRVE